MPINFFPPRKIFTPGVKTPAFWQPWRTYRVKRKLGKK